MWRILLLLLFAKESTGCECPGIIINGTDQPHCWQIVDRNAGTWSSADDACGEVGGRMGQPEDNKTLIALAGYLKKVYSLPVLTGYVVGNEQTGEIAMVCRENRFLAIANGTDSMIKGEPSDAESCVFITNDDYLMHYGACRTVAVVLCSQPMQSNDQCAVSPTCASSTTIDYNATTTYRTGTGNGLDNSTRSSSFSPPTGTFSTLSTTAGTGPTPASTPLLSSTSTSPSGGAVGTTTKSNKSECRSSGMMLWGWCVPIWLFAVAVASLIGFLVCCCCSMILCCCLRSRAKSPKAAAAVVKDVEKGPAVAKQSKAVQSDPPAVEPQITLPPPVMQTAAVIPAPIPIDYHTMMDKPPTDDKGIMTDPWEPTTIYRDRMPEPKVDYEKEERMLLPPAPMTARTEAPPLMESEDEDPIRRRLVAAPIPVILRPRRRAPSPDLLTPRDPFPALPRRALTDDDIPMEPRAPREKKQKKERPHLEPVVFRHNAEPEERPAIEEPEPEPAPSRGPRAFPPPPPGSRSSTIQDRPFPEQFKSPSPGPKQSRLLPSPPSPPEQSKRGHSHPAPFIAPPKQSRPLTRTPINRPVITQQPEPSRNFQPPQAAAPLRSPAEPVKPPSAGPAPVRSSSGERRAQPVAPPARSRTISPTSRAPAQRAVSPFAPKQNSVSPAPQGSLFKAAPSNPSTPSNLKAANGKLGGVVGGHGEVPRGWKAWSSKSGGFSNVPGADI